MEEPVKRNRGRQPGYKKKITIPHYPKSDEIRASPKDLAERLNIVLLENGYSIDNLQLICNQNTAYHKPIANSTLRLIAKGEANMDIRVVNTVCHKLGYSSDWFLFGTGEKKGKTDSKKLFTDVQQFRLEAKFEQQKIYVLQSQVKRLFEMVEDLQSDNDVLNKKLQQHV